MTGNENNNDNLSANETVSENDTSQDSCIDDPLKILNSSASDEPPNEIEIRIVEAMMLAARRGEIEHTQNELLGLTKGVLGSNNLKKQTIQRLVGKDILRDRRSGNSDKYCLRVIVEAVRDSWGDDPDDGNDQ